MNFRSALAEPREINGATNIATAPAVNVRRRIMDRVFLRY
jgi:hypothetical protein